MTARAAKPTSRRGSATRHKGRLKVHDPFELIRWLALSQPDPRKALAELVQNSLDAGARSIEITRGTGEGDSRLRSRRRRGRHPRARPVEALRYIATHVGHSRKRYLTPSERLELMMQGSTASACSVSGASARRSSCAARCRGRNRIVSS